MGSRAVGGLPPKKLSNGGVIVLKHGKFILVVAALFVAGVVGSLVPRWPGSLGVSASSTPVPAPESEPQKTAGPPAAAPNSTPEVLVDDYTRHLLLMMDTDKSGKVSKREFMSFMSKEFDRLDTNHDGQLDVHELAKWQVNPYVGK